MRKLEGIKARDLESGRMVELVSISFQGGEISEVEFATEEGSELRKDGEDMELYAV